MLVEIGIGILWVAAIGYIANEHDKNKKAKKEKEKEEIIREVEERIRKNDEMLNKMGAFDEGSPKMRTKSK